MYSSLASKTLGRAQRLSSARRVPATREPPAAQKPLATSQNSFGCKPLPHIPKQARPAGSDVSPVATTGPDTKRWLTFSARDPFQPVSGSRRPNRKRVALCPYG